MYCGLLIMIDFGGLLKRFRTSNSLSQHEFVDIVIHNDNKLLGLDVVTISRWENRVVVPTHRRQIEVFHAIYESYFELIMKNRDLLVEKFKPKIIEKSNVWERIDNTGLRNVISKRIETNDRNGNAQYCMLYTDSNGIPIGQITYKHLSKNTFWNVMNKSNGDCVDRYKTEICLQVISMFCLNKKVIPHMLGLIISKLLSQEVDIIGFSSRNSKSNLKKFFKSIGFKVHKENRESTSLVLTYYDALYNKELFYCSILAGTQGDSNVK